MGLPPARGDGPEGPGRACPACAGMRTSDVAPFDPWCAGDAERCGRCGSRRRRRGRRPPGGASRPVPAQEPKAREARAARTSRPRGRRTRRRPAAAERGPARGSAGRPQAARDRAACARSARRRSAPRTRPPRAPRAGERARPGRARGGAERAPPRGRWWTDRWCGTPASSRCSSTVAPPRRGSPRRWRPGPRTHARGSESDGQARTQQVLVASMNAASPWTRSWVTKRWHSSAT